jgi:hypothetical protein
MQQLLCVTDLLVAIRACCFSCILPILHSQVSVPVDCGSVSFKAQVVMLQVCDREGEWGVPIGMLGLLAHWQLTNPQRVTPFFVVSLTNLYLIVYMPHRAASQA